MPELYQIIIKGHLDQCWTDWFAGLMLTHIEDQQTLISGDLPDQAALHGLLERIRDLNLELISVTRNECADEASDKEIGWNTDRTNSVERKT